VVNRALHLRQCELQGSSQLIAVRLLEAAKFVSMRCILFVQKLSLLGESRVRRFAVANDLQDPNEWEVPEMIKESNLNLVLRQIRVWDGMLDSEHERNAAPYTVLDRFDAVPKLR
jgi:hypothetical protein